MNNFLLSVNFDKLMRFLCSLIFSSDRFSDSSALQKSCKNIKIFEVRSRIGNSVGFSCYNECTLMIVFLFTLVELSSPNNISDLDGTWHISGLIRRICLIKLKY